MSSTKKIILTGWGTGWHAFPLVSIYNYLQESRDYDFLWLWERDSIEQELAESHNIDFRDISAGRIRRYFDLRNLYEPLKNLTGIVESIYHILKQKWDIIFSKWGFVALPVCIAGWILRKKIYIHESDSVMGLSNKICAPLATKIFYSFPNEKTGLSGESEEETWEEEKKSLFSFWKKKKKTNKHIYSGHILNSELLESITDTQIEENETLSVLVVAGSQGSTRIFENLLQILPDCKDINFQVIFGDKNQHFREDFLKFVNVKSYDFVSPRMMWNIMKDVDIAVTRGSSTLWELYYFGIHAIVIPLKATGWNHQYHNGMYFNANFGSDVLDEDENLHLEMFRRIQKYKELRKTGLNLEWFFDGVKVIQSEIEKI